MSRTTLGDDIVRGWEIALDTQRPPTPDNADRMEFPQVEALSPCAVPDGMIVRMRTQDGTSIEFEVNAVAAKFLAANILALGQQAGWLDHDFNVVTPRITLNS